MCVIRITRVTVRYGIVNVNVYATTRLKQASSEQEKFCKGGATYTSDMTNSTSSSSSSEDSLHQMGNPQVTNLSDVKASLKQTIQKRRRASGKPEIVLQPKKRRKIPEEEMTEADLIRLERRRKSNRESAEKYRHKKERESDILKQEYQETAEQNVHLRAEYLRLLSECESSQADLEHHYRNCPVFRIRYNLLDDVTHDFTLSTCTITSSHSSGPITEQQRCGDTTTITSPGVHGPIAGGQQSVCEGTSTITSPQQSEPLTGHYTVCRGASTVTSSHVAPIIAQHGMLQGGNFMASSHQPIISHTVELHTPAPTSDQNAPIDLEISPQIHSTDQDNISTGTITSLDQVQPILASAHVEAPNSGDDSGADNEHVSESELLAIPDMSYYSHR